MNIHVKPNKKRPFIAVIIFIILVVAAAGGYYWYTSTNNTANDSNSSQNADDTPAVVQPDANIEKIVHFSAMGDMLAHDTIIANAKTSSGYDFTKFFGNIKPTYSPSEVVFCNQEGLSSGESFVVSGYPSFNAPTQFATDLSGVGCNLINLANNHMGDKGVAATNATIDVWNGLRPLGFSGANKSADDQNKVSFFEINGIKLGFVSFADFNNNNSTPGYSINNYHDEALVKKLVKDARDNADVVIVSMHWGVEDSNTVSGDQITQANLLNSLGVDVIIGTGPHVLQKMHTVKRSDGHKTAVWYSLGNMLSSQLNINQLIGGIAMFDVEKTDAGKIVIKNQVFVPTYMHYEWTATEAANGDLLARKNAMIYLLDEATVPLSKSLFNTTVAAQKQYVKDTLGDEVTIK